MEKPESSICQKGDTRYCTYPKCVCGVAGTVANYYESRFMKAINDYENGLKSREEVRKLSGLK